jgi:hypothetical protein
MPFLSTVHSSGALPRFAGRGVSTFTAAPCALRHFTGAFWRGRLAQAGWTCWFAVATLTFTVTAFPLPVETAGSFSLGQQDGLRHRSAVSYRRQPRASMFANSGSVATTAVGARE